MPKTKERPTSKKAAPKAPTNIGPCTACREDMDSAEGYSRWPDGPDANLYHPACVPSKDELDLGDTAHGKQAAIDGSGTHKKAPPADVCKAAQAFVSTKTELDILKARLENRRTDLQAAMRKHDVPQVTVKVEYETFMISRENGEEKLRVEKVG